jgi:Rps23 Pro-64 3,4-dihydroxylase Tpa1-like proline 4-hydroxylase
MSPSVRDLVRKGRGILQKPFRSKSGKLASPKPSSTISMNAKPDIYQAQQPDRYQNSPSPSSSSPALQRSESRTSTSTKSTGYHDRKVASLLDVYRIVQNNARQLQNAFDKQSIDPDKQKKRIRVGYSEDSDSLHSVDEDEFQKTAEREFIATLNELRDAEKERSAHWAKKK